VSCQVTEFAEGDAVTWKAYGDIEWRGVVSNAHPPVFTDKVLVAVAGRVDQKPTLLIQVETFVLKKDLWKEQV